MIASEAPPVIVLIMSGTPAIATIAMSPATVTLEVPLIVLPVISRSPVVTLITAEPLPMIVLWFISRPPAVTRVAV